MGTGAAVSAPVDATDPEKTQPETTDPEKTNKRTRGMLAIAGLFGTDAAALTLLDADHCEVWVAASNVTARVAQDLEYTLDEGPARDATATNAAILERGQGLPTRWRHYGPAVRQIGIEAVAAVPLPWSAGYLGALTIFDPTERLAVEFACGRWRGISRWRCSTPMRSRRCLLWVTIGPRCTRRPASSPSNVDVGWPRRFCS